MEVSVIQPVKIRLERDCKYPYAVTFEARLNSSGLRACPIGWANEQIRQWAIYMPDGDENDIIFRITYADGHVYQGMYMLYHKDARRLDDDILGSSIRRVLEIKAGLRQPGHLDEEQYDHILNTVGSYRVKVEKAEMILRKSRAERWLNGYRYWARQL